MIASSPLQLPGNGTARQLRCRVLQSPLAGVSECSVPIRVGTGAVTLAPLPAKNTDDGSSTVFEVRGKNLAFALTVVSSEATATWLGCQKLKI